MAGCHVKPAERSQTGFRVADRLGIYTALHGVVGCSRITLRSHDDQLGRDSVVHIVKIDIDRDIALLSSRDLEGKPRLGMEVASSEEYRTVKHVFVRGFPLAIDDLRSSLEIRVPALISLSSILPPVPRSKLRSRDSPSIMLTVLSIQGDLLPGHSGAPILDDQGRVLAMADGGLRGTGIGWAVPFNDIDLEDDLDTQRLKILQEANVGELFAFESPQGPREPPKEPPTEETPGTEAHVRQDADGFSFDLEGCRLAGGEIECDLAITNKRETRALKLLFVGGPGSPSSRLIDEGGNEYWATAGSIGSSQGRYPIGELVTGVPLRASVRFESVGAKIKEAKLLELGCRENSGGFYGNTAFSVRFHDVAIHRQ